MAENLKEYCEVRLPAADVVLKGPQRLPNTYTDYQGNYWANLRTNPFYTDAQLVSIGWYPYIESDAGAPGEYYNRSLSDFIINPTSVTRNAVYAQWDIEQVRTHKNNELENTVRQFKVNELAVNPKVREYVNFDAQWMADKQAELAVLTDWNAVAAFDTSKPLVFTLANSVVAASYVEQGTVLTSQNQADQASGLTPRWDQTVINSFVASNQTAANDSSNATAPVKPGYKIRQGIANVAEQFNRVVIWRFDVEGETDPNLDRSMAMQMTNRQDNRDIYVFIYTGAGSTYLGWKKFEDQGSGVWKWFLDKNAGDGSIMTWTDSDIAFIMSYGTNPAVENDFFTDQVQFPAGQESRNLLVAWDPT